MVGNRSAVQTVLDPPRQPAGVHRIRLYVDAVQRSVHRPGVLTLVRVHVERVLGPERRCHRVRECSVHLGSVYGDHESRQLHRVRNWVLVEQLPGEQRKSGSVQHPLLLVGVRRAQQLEMHIPWHRLQLE